MTCHQSTGARRLALALLAFLPAVAALAAAEPKTERRFLSGHGPKDAIPWEFTVTGGRRAGEKSTLPVPSNWELHGFGSYHYGQQKVKSDEHGLYRTTFALPPEWKDRRIWLVFEGVMTDATVKVNGKPAGPTHQGGFNRFRYEVTKLVKHGNAAEGENVLEVDVAKVSANAETELAERGGDYWVFGGIFRPVWLEAKPAQAIDHVAIDARADGAFTADLTLASVREADLIDVQLFDARGNVFGAAFGAAVRRGGTGRVRVASRLESPRLWSSETPVLYTARFALKKGAETLHVVEQRFGFRTIEVRDGVGIFVNGQRVILKGVNRHSFRPATGRALNPEDQYTDVRLMKEMNMNSVRMSHYPPDEVFLDACDELGLYVLNELSGWQKAHGTAVGRLLVRELVERDVNHPSVLFWDNGNEGGWNRDLDGEFALYDPQHRRVIHAWELFDGLNTKHYPNYDDLVALLRGPDLVMPTEFLHALYDGGAGAGLEDYWNAITSSPVGAGGFIWVYADEGVVRSDLGGKIDVFSTFAPDGIVGPNLEKEGSFHTVRDLWSPVQIEAPKLDAGFDGALKVRNDHDFTSLAQCRFKWQWLQYDVGAREATQRLLGAGEVAGPAVGPHAKGTLTLPLPPNWREADALALTALSANGESIWTWTWATPALERRIAANVAPAAAGTGAQLEQTGSEIRLSAAGTVATFDRVTGLLREVTRDGKAYGLTAGPRLAFARPPANAAVEWLPFTDGEIVAGTRQVAKPGLANLVEIEFVELRGADAVGVLTLEISPDGKTWHTVFDATRRPQDGARFEFAPQHVAAVRLSNVRRFDGRPPVLKTFRLGYTAERFPAAVTAGGQVTTGTDRDGGQGPASAWIAVQGGGSGLDSIRWTMQPDGALRLDYAYALDGVFAYHGITFDHPAEAIASFRWLGQGPYRVWQNRLRGTTLGIHEHVRRVQQPGESWVYPEYEGYFAGLRWAEFATTTGRFSLTSTDDRHFLRVGTPRISAATTTVDFPPGEISIVHAIPAIGSKGKPPERAGPQSQYAVGKGTYKGTVVFRFW